MNKITLLGSTCLTALLLTSCGGDAITNSDGQAIEYAAVAKWSQSCQKYINYLECSFVKNPEEQKDAIKRSIEAVSNFPAELSEQKCGEAYGVLVEYKDQAEEFGCLIEDPSE